MCYICQGESYNIQCFVQVFLLYLISVIDFLPKTSNNYSICITWTLHTPVTWWQDWFKQLLHFCEQLKPKYGSSHAEIIEVFRFTKYPKLNIQHHIFKNIFLVYRIHMKVTRGNLNKNIYLCYSIHVCINWYGNVN